MKTHHGDLFAVFNKKTSSFALYDGKDGDNFLPYQVSPKFRPRDLDKKFITGLREWLVNFQIDGGIFKRKLIINKQRIDFSTLFTFAPSNFSY